MSSSKQEQVKVSSYVDVPKRAIALGMNAPTGFAILPRRFDTADAFDGLMHEDTAPTVRALLRDAEIVETPLEKEGQRIPYIEENSFEWVGPAIFIGASVFSGNSNAIGISLGVIANYLTDYFKGRVGDNKVKLQLVIPQQREGEYAKIEYEGEVGGIKELQKLIKEVRNGRMPK